LPSPPQTVVDGDGDGAGGGPGTAVVVEPKSGCEGDEYEITSDGSESEIELEGRLDEVGDLLDRVASENDCVEVRVELIGEEEEELEPVLP
jgi:hypothetical protein